MKFFKKICIVIVFLIVGAVLVACDGSRETPPLKEPNQNTSTVQIKSLSAELNELTHDRWSLRRNAIMSFDSETETEKPIVPAGQYVVMYKSQSEITFTIKLDNPKGESIDAIELTCDDPDAEILTDGKYKPIQFHENESGLKSRIINWAQEDPYEKVYYIRTTSNSDINTLRVLDLKVNGEWQNVELDNNQLTIYKMEEDDLEWNFIQNSPYFYKWSFEKSDRITNLVVKLAGKVIEPDENGTYTVTQTEAVEWEYDYTFDGFTAHWKDERDIELVEWVYHREVQKGPFILTGGQFDSSTQVWITKIIGTDIDKISICKEPDMIPFELSYNMNNVLEIPTVLFTLEDGDICYLQFGGSTYYIDTENLKLVWVM